MTTTHDAVIDPDHWAIDKRVNIAAILTLLAQTCVIVWCVATLSANVNNQERRLTAIEARLGDNAELIAITKLQAQIEEYRVRLERISQDLTQVQTIRDKLETLTSATLQQLSPSQRRALNR